MTEHWCSEHKAVFFKKGKMRRYAHPIGDTGEWCNEPEEGGDPIPEDVKPKTAPPVAKPTAVKSDSKNKAFALSYAKDISCALISAGKPASAISTIDIAVLFESYLDNGAEVIHKKGG